MACNKPLQAWQRAKPNKNGKFPPVFSNPGMGAKPILVDCGRCMGCRVSDSQQLSIRMQHEALFHDQCSFVTLTYDDENLPEHGSLSKRDHQLFLKRLRKHFRAPIRYVLVGEYGDQTYRPHYHAVIYGVDFREDRRQCGKSDRGDIRYRSETLNKLWGLGRTEVSQFTPELASYISGYIQKKLNGDRAENRYTRLDPSTGEVFKIQPEYCARSLRPGIGQSFLDKFKSDLYPSDFTVVRGKQKSVPKFYDKKLESTDPALLEAVREKRKQRAFDKRFGHRLDRQNDREIILKAKAKLKTRKL